MKFFNKNRLYFIFILSHLCCFSVDIHNDYIYNLDYQKLRIFLNQDKKNKFDLELFISIINDLHLDKEYFKNHEEEFLELEITINKLLSHIQQRNNLFKYYRKSKQDSLSNIQDMFENDHNLMEETNRKTKDFLDKLNQYVYEHKPCKASVDVHESLSEVSKCLEKKDYTCFSTNLEQVSTALDTYFKYTYNFLDQLDNQKFKI